MLELHQIGSHCRYLGSNCLVLDPVVHCRCMRSTTHGVLKRQHKRPQNLPEWSSGQLCDACASVCVRPAVGTHCCTVLAMCGVVMLSESGCIPVARDHGAVGRRCLELCGTIHETVDDGDPYRREVCFPWGIDTRLGRIAIDIHSSVTFGLSCKSQERLRHSHTVVPMRIPHLRSAGLRWLPCFQRHPAGT